MQYAVEYVRGKRNIIEVLKQINYVRLKKGVLLPCEVVGARGRLRTECFNDIEQPSPINWEFEKITSAPINRVQKTIWNDFIKWMRLQQVETKWDFVAKWKWRITRDESIVVIDDGECKTTYRRMDNNSCNYEQYDIDITNESFKGCIGRKNSDGTIRILSKEEHTEGGNNEDAENEIPFPQAIVDDIVNKTAVAATDAAIAGQYIATHWIVSTKQNEVEIEGGIVSSRWREGLIPSGEGIGLLDLIKHVVKATKDVPQGEICIYNDNKKLLKEIQKEVHKERDCTQEAGAVVAAIKREIDKTRVTIRLEYANNKPRNNATFEQQSGQFLMKRCDSEAKRKCVALIDQEDVCTIKYKGIAAPILENDCIIDKNINVLIREIDAKYCEEIAAKERVKEGWE